MPTEGAETADSLKPLLETTYPLLQIFKEQCPGTFKHSQAVASIVEGVALALGLDSTFMKVAALYHDVGKIMNPTYFSENQMDATNPHDTLDPRISYQIISRHVSDTALILLRYDDFPRNLIKIATQHHGTSVVKYFFKKSKGVSEDFFRYKGERPTCVEAAILMIADSLDARMRSLLQSNGKKITPMGLVEETINDLMGDGQLDDVYMRLGDLQTIKTALARELEGSLQKRVSYEEVEEESEKE